MNKRLARSIKEELEVICHEIHSGDYNTAAHRLEEIITVLEDEIDGG